MKITKKAVVEAIELSKDRNCWALSENVEITFDHETESVVVWNSIGDYDAWFKETELDLIVAEAQGLEDFYTK